MREILGGDLFHYIGFEWVGITTNGFVKNNGEAVMGRGVALQASQRVPKLKTILGTHLNNAGNIPLFIAHHKIVTIPVKHKWWEKADLDLIIKSLTTIKYDLEGLGIRHLYMPRPGCGNGQLGWPTVKGAIRDLLDDRFIIVEKYGV